jgi:hypothetical protein
VGARTGTLPVGETAGAAGTRAAVRPVAETGAGPAVTTVATGAAWASWAAGTRAAVWPVAAVLARPAVAVAIPLAVGEFGTASGCGAHAGRGGTERVVAWAWSRRARAALAWCGRTRGAARTGSATLAWARRAVPAALTTVASTVARGTVAGGTVTGGTVTGGTVAGGTVAGGTVAGGTAGTLRATGAR